MVRKKKDKRQLFGTSGIRHIFHPHGEGFTPHLALKLGLALGTHVKGGTVVVGRDIRTSALPVELALNSGLVSTGCRVLRLGIVTTPTLAMATKFLKGDAGVIITASHNTPEYIGVKFWNNSGLGFTPGQELEIERIFRTQGYRDTPWNKVGTVVPISDINGMHVEQIMTHFQFPRSNRRLNLIIDPGNGSSCEIAPLLLNHMKVKYVTLNSQPDGSFPGRLSEPSEENLKTLSNLIRASPEFDFGVALDGDADRVVFLDERGNRIEPVKMLALFAKKMLEDNYHQGRFEPIVVTPIDSTSVLEAVVKPLGGRVVRSQVGDIKVAIKIKEMNAMLGGETAGTYIWPSFHLGPDSLVTLAKVIEMLELEGEPLSSMLSELPDFPYLKREIRLSRRNQTNQAIVEKLKEAAFQELENLGESDISVREIDGIRFDSKDGWILFRESGTSPFMRLMVESNRSEEHVGKLMNLGVKIVRELYDTSEQD
ncbi:MAG: phosphoglucosamine mutase [Promethearchaeota archaeon]